MSLFLIFWPLAVSLMLFVLRPKHAKYWAFVASLIEAGVAFYVFYLFDNDGTVQFVYSRPWIAKLGVDFYIGMDGISFLLVLLTSVLVPFIILSSFDHSYSKPHIFYGLVLLMQMALVGVFVARDGFLFYIFWELALIPIYFICLIWGGADRMKVTLKFFIYTLAGSLLMLVGLIFIYLHTPSPNTFNIQALYRAAHLLSPTHQGFYFWLFFAAFAIKMPVFPFHTWQPDTYTEAPATGTMLLSGIMLKMGVFGLIRWLLPMFPLGVQQWGMTAVVLSVTGIVYASAIALVQKDFKRLIAYSSIAHVGLISAGVMTQSKLGIQGAMIQMLSHGLLVFALFYIVDIIETRTRTRTIDSLGGIRQLAPILTTVFTVVMLGSVALPFTSGFVGEFLLINSLVNYKLVLGVIAGLTIILGAVYMFRAFQRSMLGETNSVTQGFTDLTLREKFVLYPVIVLVVTIGVYPAPLLAISEPAVNNLLLLVSLLR
jgi:NADH-quinone oxidoreductase subunit M